MIPLSTKFVPKGPINKSSPQVRILVWRLKGIVCVCSWLKYSKKNIKEFVSKCIQFTEAHKMSAVFYLASFKQYPYPNASHDTRNDSIVHGSMFLSLAHNIMCVIVLLVIYRSFLHDFCTKLYRCTFPVNPYTCHVTKRWQLLFTPS